MEGHYFDGNGTGPRGSFRGRENLNSANTINGAWVLQGGRTFRTTIIVLATINLAAAIAMIANILFDAWTVRRWDFETKKQKYLGWLFKIHPAEMFPLIVSGAVVLQSVVVIPVQGLNTSPILFDGCVRTVQLVWPAIWIAPVTNMVFGMETTFRALRRNKFPSRNRWHFPTALAVIVALTIFLWAASNVFPTRGACVTGLIWWTARYFKLAIVVSSGLLFLFMTAAIIITVQLTKTVKMDRAERIAATRVVYYLVANTWIILFVLPYYIQIATNARAQMSAQIAEIALSITGIINLLMHVFLRSNADRLAIRSAQTPWTEKRTMRVFGPSDLNMREHISYPVLWQVGDHDNDSFIATSEKSSVKSSENSDYDSFSTCGPLQHAVFPSPKSNSPVTPNTRNSPARQVTRNNSAYSIFPTSASSQQAHMSTSTTFSRFKDEYEMPLPPPPLFATQHERNDSVQTRASSATVQIGLRLSYLNHALDPIGASPSPILQLPLKSTESITLNPETHRPDIRRASASSDVMNTNAMLPSQSYSKAQTQQSSSSQPRAWATPPPIYQKVLPPLSIPQADSQVAALAPVLETLTNQAFRRPQDENKTVSPIDPIRPHIRVAVPSQQSAEKVAPGTTPRTAMSPKSVASSNGGGLPKGPKAAPSWRPQNWNMEKDRMRQDDRVRKASGSDKSLPKVPESAQLDESPLGGSNNPWKTSKPQVIHRPPGWV